MRIAVFLIAATVMTSSSGVMAQGWVDTLVPEDSFDFGPVARGSKIKHTFRVVNSSGQTVHIASWQTKCGCTDVRVGARELPPGTQTFVEATIDTTRFTGYKASGLTLVFDRPTYGTKDLNLKCYIRPEISLNPGAVEFGAVKRAQQPDRVLELSYNGNQPNWGIVKLQTQSEHVSARLEEVQRSPGTTAVKYRLTVTLNPSAPVGFFRDQVSLVTNDPTPQVIPVSVGAQIQGNIVVNPAILSVGTLKAGQTVSKAVLVNSDRPFLVRPSTSADAAIEAKPTAAVETPLQRVQVTFKAPDQAGPYHEVLEIRTSLEGEPPAMLSVFATVTP